LTTIPIMILPLFIFIKFKSEARKLLLLLPLLGLIILPWLIRNVILTGWLIYPFHSLDLFDFDWKVPISGLISMDEAITGWARNPGEQYIAASHMNMYEWIPIWWHSLSKIDSQLVLLSIVFPLLIFTYHILKKTKLDFHVFLITFTSFCGITFWFFLAPDLRFGKAFIIISVISPLLWFNFKLYLRPIFKSIYMFLSIIIILFVSLVKINIGFNILKITYENSNRIITPQIIQIPSNTYFKKNKKSGVVIYVPTKGDRCFYQCLPCIPHTVDAIKLRDKTLQSGFKPI
jgi:hypothetical protein